MAKTLYTARARATGGRDGRARTADGRMDLLIKPPPELGGPDQPEATNPEELFALGYGACFLNALSLVARLQKISAKAFHVDSAVDFVLGDDDRTFSLAVELRAEMPGVDDEKAQELLRRAHRACPYSRATRGNIPVRLFAGDREVTPPAPSDAAA